MTTEAEDGAAVVVAVPAPVTVFGTDEPEAIVQRVAAIAGPLADFITKQHMSTQISGREYVLCEGWAFMGSMLGVFPVTTGVDVIRDRDDDFMGFEAHVELRARDGSVVGGAIAECTRLEENWSDRDSFALKSMAQTRATGKAYRMAFGFVMKAAGYEATPAEEMPVASARPPLLRVEPPPQERSRPQRTPDALPEGPPPERPEGVSPDALPGAPDLQNRGQLLAYATQELGYENTQEVLGALGFDDVKEIPVNEIVELGERLHEIALERRKPRAAAPA